MGRVGTWRWREAFGRGTAGESVGTAAAGGGGADAGSIPALAVYPAQDPGLPALPPETLLRAAEGRLARLRELVASEPGGFGPAWLAPVEALAREVHLLPASADAHYAAPAGLFHCALDVAFHALQAAGGRIFTADAGKRHALEPRWRYAVFLAGLAWPTRRTLAQLTAADDAGREWAPVAGPLWEWLRAGDARRYFAVWLGDPASSRPSAGPAWLERIVPRERLAWLAQGDVRITQALMAAAESDGADAPLALVARMGERVLAADAAQQRHRYGRLLAGTHLEPLLLDALRAAVESGIWLLNEGASPLWWGRDGLFLEWPAAHAQAVGMLEQSGAAGCPRSPWTWAECLGRAGAVQPAAQGGWLHPVSLPGPDGGRRTHALHFADPACLLGLQQGPVLPFALRAAHGEEGSHAPIAPDAATDPPPALRWLPAAMHGAVLQLAAAQGEGNGATQAFPWGVAMRADWLAGHSPVPLADWIRAFEANAWLVLPPACRHPAARLHEIAFGGQPVKALALSLAGAAALGVHVRQPP